MTYIRGIEAARGGAAVLVMLAHINNIMSLAKYGAEEPWFGFFRFGHAGVDFFFVLSGFIITYVHASDIGRPERLGDYTWRRFCRIFPLWWVVLAATLPVFFLKADFGSGYETNPADIALSFALLPWINPPIIPVAWSLCHEILFYSIFGLGIARPRLGFAVFAVWQLGVMAWGFLFPMPDYPWQFLTATYNAEFLLGIAVALLVRRRMPDQPWVFLAAGITLFVLPGMLENGGILPMAPADLFRYTTILYAPGAALIIYALVGLETKNTAIPAWMQKIGAASYAIYLTHVVAISACMKFAAWAGFTGSWLLTWIFVAMVTLTAGLAVHQFVEAPLLRKLTGRKISKTGNR